MFRFFLSFKPRRRAHQPHVALLWLIESFEHSRDDEENTHQWAP
jgi:hypothetical protein